MTMRSRLLLLLVVAAIVGGAFYFLRSPAAPVDGGTTVPAGGGAQTSRQGNPVGDVRLESLDRQDDAQVDAQPRCIPIRRESVRLLPYHRNQRLECRSSLCHKRRPDRHRLLRFRSGSSGISISQGEVPASRGAE